jgi:hypothetical protein
MNSYTPWRIERFLNATRSIAYCDACLAQALGLAPDDVIAAVRLGARVERAGGRCMLCGEQGVCFRGRHAVAA